MKKIILLSLFSIFHFSLVFGQDSNASIGVLSRVTRDSVILRWAPTTPVAWLQGNRFGYSVKKYIVSENGVIDTVSKPQAILMTPQPIKPFLLAAWEPLAKEDKFAAIAAQALYGKDFIVSNSGSQKDGLNLYHQTEEQESRYSFALYAADLSSQTASALGLRFVDTNLDTTKRYAYKIEIANYTNNEYPIEAGTIFIDPTDIRKLPPVEGLKSEPGDGAVLLSWNTVYINQTYVSYAIERSEDNGKSFQSLGGDSPFLNTRQRPEFPDEMFYLDSIPQNQKVYLYRIKGITPFGEYGPYSSSIRAAGINSAQGMVPTIKTLNLINEKDVELTWEFPEAQTKAIKGFKVARAKSDKGPYTIISSETINSKTFSFVDKNPNPVNYYVVKIIDEQGKESGTSFPSLFQLEDNEPPTPPVGLHGEVDSLGIVTLTWTPNTEQDIAGYHVFRSNSLKEEFVQVTRDIMLASVFTDTITLSTLTRDVYYEVVALDNHFNPSAYSQPLKLARPDIIPPSPVQFHKAESTDAGITLAWFPAVSVDALKYRLLRKEKDSFVAIKEILVADSILSYIDRDVKPGRTYQYQIMVIDQSGLISAPTTIGVNCIDYGIRPEIEQVNYKIDREKNVIILSWQYNESAISGYQIYRSKLEGPLRLHKFVKSNSYTDRQLTINTTYRYSVKAIFESGAESRLSKVVSVKY